MKRLIATVAAATLVMGAVQPAQAQDESDIIAFFALSSTPHGALPAVVTPGMTGSKGTQWDFRYGRHKFDGADDSFNTYGVGGNFALGARGRLGVDAGYQTCGEDCDAILMAGVDYSMNLVQRSLGTGASASSMVIGVRPAFGYGKQEDLSSMALSIDAPISVSMKVGQRINAVPFLAPGLGWGRLSDGDDSESGTKMSLGGGIGFTNVVGNVGLNVGFRKIFVEDAPTQFGLGMSWTR